MSLEFTKPELDIAQEVRFRCPHCQKLYCTQNDVFAGSLLSQPAFDCTSCSQAFSLTHELNEVGLYVTTTHNQAQFAECPKCTNLKPLKSDECPTCGVLVSKFEELQKIESPALFELSQLWQKVLADFTLATSHQNFINACHQKMALNFAYKKYSELKSSVGFDMSCVHYMKQVELRLEEQFKAQEAVQAESRKSYLTRAQTVFLCVGLIGVLSLLFNKIRPTFPNLTGLVVAVTILSFGLVFLSGNEQHIKLD